MSLERTVQAELAKKYDVKLERTLREWMGGIFQAAGEKPLAERILSTTVTFLDLLKDGEILCRLMNLLSPGTIKTVNTNSTVAFKQMENINAYLKACPRFGIPKSEQFTTIDLFEGKGMLMVLRNVNRLYQIQQQHQDALASLVQAGQLEKAEQPKSLDLRESTLSKVPTTEKPFSPVNSTPSPVGSEPQNVPAFRAPADVSSLQSDVEAMQLFKFDPVLERQAKTWIEEVTQTKFPEGVSFANSLKSGVILCQLINKIKPGMIAKVNTRDIAYQQMENIQEYLKACTALGLRTTDLFNTVDLFESKNMNVVVNHIHVLGNHVGKMKDYHGPQIEDGSKSKNLFSATLTNQEGILDRIEKEAFADLPEDQKELVTWLNTQIQLGHEYALQDPGFSDNTLSKKLPVPKLQNLRADLVSGVNLLRLLEAVTRTPINTPYHKEPTTLWHCMQNASGVIRFLSAQTFADIQGCTAVDIVTGNVKELMVLIRFIRDTFDIEFLYNKLLNEQPKPAESEDEPATPDREVFQEKPLLVIEETREDQELASSPSYFASLPRKSFSRRSSSAAGERPQIPPPFKEPSKEPPKDPQPTLVPKERHTWHHKTPSKDFGVESFGDFVKEQPKQTTQEPAKAPTTTTTTTTTTQQGPPSSAPTTAESTPKAVPEREVPKYVLPIKPAPASSPVPTTTTTSNQSSTLQVDSKPASMRTTKTRPVSANLPTSSPSPPKTEEDFRQRTWSTTRTSPVKDALRPQEPGKTPSPTNRQETHKEAEANANKTSEPPSNAERRGSKESQPGMTQPKVEEKREMPGSKVEDRKREPQRQQEEHKGQDLPAKTEAPAPPKIEAPAKVETPEQRAELKRQHAVVRKDNSQNDVKKDPGEQVDPRVIKAQNGVRRKIADEILSTERNYVLHLQVLVQKFLKPVEALNILSKDELYKLTANLSEIIDFHKLFLEKLQDRIGKWNDSSNLSDIFQEDADFFNNYLPYMMNFGESLLNFALVANKYKEIGPILKAFEDFQAKSSRLSLESLVVMPVQRLPRYILLLKEMKKYTGKVNPKEEEMLGVVLDKIQGIMTNLNQKTPKGNLESVKQLQMILESVEGELHTILDTKSVFIREGVLKLKKFKVAGDAKGTWGSAKTDQLHTCFLLQHLLIICKFNDKGSKLPHKMVFYATTKDFEKVSYSPQTKAKSGVVIHLSGEGMIQLNAKDTEEAKEWVSDIEALLARR